jgi:hypothetical protein
VPIRKAILEASRNSARRLKCLTIAGLRRKKRRVIGHARRTTWMPPFSVEGKGTGYEHDRTQSSLTARRLPRLPQPLA